MNEYQIVDELVKRLPRNVPPNEVVKVKLGGNLFNVEYCSGRFIYIDTEDLVISADLDGNIYATFKKPK